jgi:hypothetical protein
VKLAYMDYEGTRYWFASPDGKLWLDTSRRLIGADQQEFMDRFNGIGMKVNPMKLHRNFLKTRGAVFL